MNRQIADHELSQVWEARPASDHSSGASVALSPTDIPQAIKRATYAAAAGDRTVESRTQGPATARASGWPHTACAYPDSCPL